MKEHNRDREDQEGSIREHFQKPAAPAALLFVIVAGLAAAGTVEINLLAADKKNRDYRHCAENRGGIKDGTSADPVAEQAGSDRGEDIAGVIERLVAADPQIESSAAHDAKGHAGHGGREKRAYYAHDNLCADNSREAVEKNDGQRANPQKGGAYGERFAFVMEPIDERADRRLRNKSSNSRRRDGHADVSRIPMQRRGEVNREKRAYAGVHIGHEKIDRVQRAKCALARCGLHCTHKSNI